MQKRVVGLWRTQEVDEYLENLAPERRAALAKLRSLVFEVASDAVETMKYRMPTYEYGDGVLCAFASQKHYMSLYMDTGVVEKHREELTGLSIGKSCIRFRKMDQLPLGTIKRMLEETVQIRRSAV
jgi:uncharacterized protein YdhG (YjbR/CyaY superfamily)